MYAILDNYSILNHDIIATEFVRKIVLKWFRNLKVGVLGLIVSLLALYFIGTQINLELFKEAFLTANYVYILPCVIFLLLGLVTRALRWRVLLSDRLPLVRAFSIMNVAYLVNGVLPLRIGEVVRIYLATRVRKPVPVWQTTGTIIVERLLDLLAVVVMMALALAMGPVPDALQTAGVFAAVVAITGFGILIVMARKRSLAEGLFVIIAKRLPFDLSTWFGQFLDGLMPLSKSHSLLRAVGWTVISWILSTIAGFILMFAFYEQGDWSATMLYIAAAAFAIAVPAVPGNIGTYEASILLALTTLGYEQTGVAVAFAVMVHAVNVFVHATTGVVGFIQEGISLDQLSQGVQQMQRETELGNAS